MGRDKNNKESYKIHKSSKYINQLIKIYLGKRCKKYIKYNPNEIIFYVQISYGIDYFNIIVYNL